MSQDDPEKVTMRKQIEIMKNRIEDLEGKLAFFTKHPTIARGARGETQIATLAGGVRTTHNKPHDITIELKELKFEVKSAALSKPSISQGTRRWIWASIYGTGGKKKYDRLVLVGETDTRYANEYRDKGSKFIIFDIPFDEVRPLTCRLGRKAGGGICLTTNPRTARASSSILFKKYQLTEEEFELRYKFKMANQAL